MAGKTRQSANLVSNYDVYANVTNNYVGIGSSAPVVKLDVAGGINASGSIGIGTTNPIGQLQVSSGPVIIGAATSTGTLSQPLQVTGGAYVSGSIGIGTTNPLGLIQVGASSTQSFVVRQVGTAVSVGIGTTTPVNTLTVVGTTDIQGAVETVSVATTYQNVVGTNIVVECDATKGTVFTHSLTNGVVGIVSLRNFPATKNSITTFTILFTQNATGTANTTVLTGIGTNIRLTPTGASVGLTTSTRVSSASTITLPTTANDIDIVTFAVHYNGAGSATTTNYTVYATDVSSFRFGNIKP